jgi:SAM-dependent methyltransferase
MQDWADGYVVDVGYTHGYFRELSPALLRFVALLGGVEVPRADPFVYYELGCGNGYSTALHAAANPQGSFVGVDFNPTHIHHAQRLAQDAGVDNVRFLEKSFGELTAQALLPADYIALHGVWSWVGEEQRAQLLEVMRRTLKPGGMVYLSYNCLPGQAQIAPLQRLLAEHAGLGAGERMDKSLRAREFAERLRQAGARFFQLNPLATVRLAALGQQNPSYVVHEYFNEHWSPFFHADVVRQLDQAKLAYTGSATLLDNFDQLALTPEQAKLVAGIPERALAETVKDYVRNQAFRRDVFTRGAPRLAPPQLEQELAQSRFALLRPRSSCRLKMPTPAGDVTLQAEAYAPVLDALARAPQTFAELARAPECAGLERTRLRQAVFGMAALGNVAPALGAEGEDARRARTRRFNQAVLGAPIASAADTYLASPVLGSGVAVNLIDRIFLGSPGDQARAVARAGEAAASGVLKLQKAGKPLESAAEVDAYLLERAQFFFADFLPFLRQLQVVD